MIKEMVPIRIGDVTGQIDKALADALAQGGSIELGGLTYSAYCKHCGESMELRTDYDGNPVSRCMTCPSCMAQHYIRSTSKKDDRLHVDMYVMLQGCGGV